MLTFRTMRGLTGHTAAKAALSLPITSVKIPAHELMLGIYKFCMNEWQYIWDCFHGNKVHSLYPNVGTVTHSKTLTRCDSVLTNRLRIGHCCLTHSCLLSGDGLPTCKYCGLSVTVKCIIGLYQLAGHS